MHAGSPWTAYGAECLEPVAPLLDDLESMRLELEVGLRDYVRQERLSGRWSWSVSGGIDSALTAAIAL